MCPTSVTVLTDGVTGLGKVQRAVVLGATHLLDWFHLAMRCQNLSQMAKGSLEPGGNVEAQQHALDELKRAKWALWNGKTIRGLMDLVHLSQWAQAPFLQPIFGS